MPINDYSEIMERLQRALAAAFEASGEFLNRPGSSAAFKIDPDYYLAQLPQFVEDLSSITGILPETVLDTLIRTGSLVSRGPERAHALSLTVHLSRSGNRSLAMRAGFLLATFVDGALKIYGGRRTGLPLSDVRLSATERPLVEAFFEGRPAPASIAYAGGAPAADAAKPAAGPKVGTGRATRA